jgi:hypothetical protein
MQQIDHEDVIGILADIGEGNRVRLQQQFTGASLTPYLEHAQDETILARSHGLVRRDWKNIVQVGLDHVDLIGRVSWIPI